MFLTSNEAEAKCQGCTMLQSSDEDKDQAVPCLEMDSLYISNSNLKCKKKSKLIISKLPSKRPLPLKRNNSSSYRTPIKYRKCFNVPPTPIIPLTISPIKMPQEESLKVDLLMNSEQNLSLKSSEQFLLRIPLEVEGSKLQQMSSTRRGLGISRSSRNICRPFKQQQSTELRNNNNTHHIVLKPRLRRYLANNMFEDDEDLNGCEKINPKSFSTPKNDSNPTYAFRRYQNRQENVPQEEKKCDDNQHFEANNSLDLSFQFTTPSKGSRSQTNIPLFYTPLASNSLKINQTPSLKSPSGSKSQDLRSPIISSSYTPKNDSRHLLLPVLAIP